MTGRIGDRGWRLPSAMTAAVAALLLLLSPVGHAWAGAGNSSSVAQSQAAHHDEAVPTVTASRAAVGRAGGHPTDLELPAGQGLDDLGSRPGQTRLAHAVVGEAGPEAAPARAPPLQD